MSRVPGHKLVAITWNGEHGEESTSTATCICGWEESASSQSECRFEYRQHLASVKPPLPLATAFWEGVAAGQASVTSENDGYSSYTWRGYDEITNPYDHSTQPRRSNG